MPTFGNTNIEPTEGSWELGLYQGCKFTKPGTGKITHVLAYIAARAGTEGPSRGGLHDTNGNKIAESINEEQLTSTFAWHDYQFNTDELPAGDYWLVVGVASTVYIRIRYSNVAGAIYTGGSFNTYPTLPSTISALPYTLKMSIYAIYETAARAPIIHVQGNARGTSWNTNTVSAILAQAPVIGNMLIAVIGIESDSIDPCPYVSRITGGGVSNWTKQVKQTVETSIDCEIWAGVVDSTPSTTITATIVFGGSFVDNVIDVCEYSGLATSNFLDKTAASVRAWRAAGGSYQTGTTELTSRADELWIGAMLGSGNVGTVSNPQNGFTLYDGASHPNVALAYLEKIVSSIGTAYSGVTADVDFGMGGCIATFLSAAGTPAPSVSVSPPNASLQVNQQQTFAAVVTGGTPPYTYQWLDAVSGTLLGNNATYVFHATAEGSYNIYLKVTDSLSAQSSSPVVPITVTTTTPPPTPDETMFDNCDAIDNWLPLSSKASDTQGDNTIEVDTIDKVEGTGSLKAVYASNAGNWGGMFYKRPTSGKWDFSQKPLIRIRMKIDKSLPNLQFGIVTGQASGWEGFNYTIADKIPVGSADYAVVTIDLRTPSPRADGMLPDLTQIIQMSYSHFDLFISSPVTIHFDQITQDIGPDIPLAVGITPNVNKNIYAGDSLTFNASGSGGKLPYAYAWYVNGLVASQTNTLVFSKPIGTYNVYCEVTDSIGTKAQSPTVVVTVQTLPPPIVPTLPNFILLQDCPWITATGAPATMRNVLNQERRAQLLRDLSYCNAKYLVVFIGYWNPTDPANPQVWHPHPITQEITDGYVRTAAFYQELIAQCHALGIQVLCWLEDSTQFGKMDISPANTPNIIQKILDAVNIGFDGFTDDIEDWVGKANTGNDVADTIANSQMQIPFYEAITDAMHAIGKIHAPATGIDWVQYLNNHLVKVDYMLSMFYSNRTTLQDSQCDGFWQEEFGELISGSHPTVTPPTAPLIIGLFFHINNSAAYDTMAEQIVKLDQLLSTYGHPNLHGFFIWFYETMKPEDWTAWNAWVKTFPSKGIPPPSSTVQHNLSILSATGGTTNPVSGNYPVYENTLQPITAIPDAGMMLDHWEFDGVSVGSSNPYAVLMNADHTLQPVFTQLLPSQVSLTVGVNPQYGGTTTPSPGTYAHTLGSSVQISATANPGYEFSHWELDGVNVSTATFYSVVMDADHTITAVFSPMPISPPQLVHTQLWRLAHQQRVKLGVGWGFPLIELYDQAVIKMRNRGR